MEVKRKKLLNIFIYTTIIALFAHGYRFMNNLYTSDALVAVFQDDIYHQRSLGRFMQPLIMVMRGVICSPWLIGCLSIVLLSLSVFFISEMLEIENGLLLFFLSGVLTCNIAVTTACAAYMPWVDVYALALLLATLGVWFYFKDKWWGYLSGSILMICSMGLYQAYIDVALALITILLIGKLLNGEGVKSFFGRMVKIVGGLIGTAVGYWCVFKLILKIHHVAEATTYNGLSEVGQYEGVSIIDLIADTYQKTFSFWLTQKTFVSTILLDIRISDAWMILLRMCFFVCAGIAIAFIVLLNTKNKTPLWSRILQVPALILFPLMCNAVNIISKGMEHDLMVYAVFFFYVLVIYMISRVHEESGFTNVKLAVTMIPIALIVWSSVVHSNQAYFKVDMQDRAALSYATRVVASIEKTEGYEPGVTPVVFIGWPEQSSKFPEVLYLRDVYCYGTDTKTPFTYGGSLPSYLRDYLAVTMNITEVDIPDPFLKEMNEYPGDNSIAYYNDILVVKFSE
ncbi:MAG: glucosyltransferase domain-containing protein [Lachnospiraceae bacterium]|nr:glucosyltransferase domain-containing protein [Lachnospiraceae bacterium]